MDSIIAHVDAIKSKPKQSDIALIHSSLEVLQDSMKKQVGAIEKALNNTEEMKSAANAHKKRTKIRNQQWENDFNHQWKNDLKANAKEVETRDQDDTRSYDDY